MPMVLRPSDNASARSNRTQWLTDFQSAGYLAFVGIAHFAFRFGLGVKSLAGIVPNRVLSPKTGEAWMDSHTFAFGIDSEPF